MKAPTMAMDFREFVFDLLGDFLGNLAVVTAAGSRESLFTENAIHGFAFADWKFWEFVAEISQGELEAVGEARGVFARFG